MASLRLSGLWVYPLKSAAGLALETARVDALGLEGDRRWMLVDDDGAPLTQREQPGLVRLHALPLPDGGLELVAPDLPPLSVPPPVDAEPVELRLWGQAARGRRVGPVADAWVSEALGRPCRLLHLPDADARPVPHPDTGGARTAFSDGFPFLLVGAGSMDALNTRTPRRFGVERFRPNLLVSGSAPFEEDDWETIRIGGIRFRVARGCPRCAVPTVDPVTGQRDPDGEPIRTLAAFRRWDGKVWFGQNLVHEGRGELRLGDAVEVLTRRGAPAA
jgi:hypothetical protein